MFTSFNRGKNYSINSLLNNIIKPEWESNFKNYGDFVSTGNISDDYFESTLDGDPVVRTYNNFTINEGHTVTTTNRCKGLYLNILGDLIVNGTLSMTARGAKAKGKYVLIDKIGRKIYHTDSINTFNNNKNFILIDKVGGLGVTNKTAWTAVSVGGSGVSGACGAGGGNYMYRGGHGTSFSGGPGAGGGASNSSSAGMTSTMAFNNCTAGNDDGGAGGNGAYDTGSGHNAQGGGGAGNPGGTVRFKQSQAGFDGTGGLMILFVSGNIIIGPNGSIQSNGSSGGNGHPTVSNVYPYSQGGGGSGGGSLHIVHAGMLSNISNITVTGGPGGGRGVGGGAGRRWNIKYYKNIIFYYKINKYKNWRKFKICF